MVQACKDQAEPEYTEGVTKAKPNGERTDVDPDIGDDMDVFLQAVELVGPASSARLRCCSATAGGLRQGRP